MSDYGTPISGILGQQDFDHAVSAWVEVINKPDEKALQESFLAGDQLLTGVGFPLERVAQLVATIGAVRVKARFLINPLVTGGKPQFLLALFAVDALDARVSSYYVAEHLYTDKLVLSNYTPGRPRIIHKNQVSNVLVRRWLGNWSPSPTVLPAYFDSHYGPLRGYTFELGEFAALFHHVQDLGGKMLRVSFVLHDFYQPGPAGRGDMLATTFALALHLDRGNKEGEELGEDDPTVNNGMPCPPYC